MKDPEWLNSVKNILKKCCEQNPLHIFGYGNTLRRDDGVGLYIVSRLSKTVKKIPGYIHIHPASASIERELKRIPKSSIVIIIDTVKIDEAPGTIIFTRFDDVESCYFDTHNIPLKFILEANMLLDNSYLLGIVPQDTNVGEGLTPIVKDSADKVLTALMEELISKFHILGG
jgi:hydrogenase maturation protease